MGPILKGWDDISCSSIWGL